MSGLNTGVCGHSGCENPCPCDEDFCCAGCEEAAVIEDGVREDEAAALEAWFGGYGAAPTPIDTSRGVRERIEALPRYTTMPAVSVLLADVLALFDPGCSLCEQGHVPARPCATEHPAVAAFGEVSGEPMERIDRELRDSVTGPSLLDASGPVSFDWYGDAEPLRKYPYTEFDEDAGVWVEWESEGIGRVVPAPDSEDAVERRVEPGF